MEPRNDGSLQVRSRDSEALILGPPSSPAMFAYRDGKYKMILPSTTGIPEWFDCKQLHVDHCGIICSIGSWQLKVC